MVHSILRYRASYHVLIVKVLTALFFRRKNSEVPAETFGKTHFRWSLAVFMAMVERAKGRLSIVADIGFLSVPTRGRRRRRT